ncbi:hypothetical protein JKP88DRAFT_275234 [Tribonema minus]|uniref:RING-type domain-containing protein n=1 Tax=Tribonema minus TaxID=303371 RepID=A0A835ZB46_9STRA|nr:hypothetical protein JKP88DRAFT_275234 [Tribonema minus]
MGNEQGVLKEGELPPLGTKLSRLGDYQIGDGKQSARRGSRGDISSLVRGAWWHGSGAEALWGSVASSNLKWTGGVTVVFMGTCVMLFAGRDPSSPLRFAMDVAGEGCHLVLPCGGIHGTPCGAPQEAHLASPRKRDGGSGSAVNSSSSSSVAAGSVEQLELKMRQVELLDVSRGVRLLLRLSTAADAQEWSSHVLEVQRRAATFVQDDAPLPPANDTWTVVSKQQCSADRGSGDRRATATFETADGGRYTGQTHLLRAHGEGTLVLPNGDTLSGAWDYDELEGQGSWSTADAAARVRDAHDAAAPVLRYDGGFSASTRHGRGTITLRDGQERERQRLPMFLTSLITPPRAASKSCFTEWECQWHGGAVQAAASGAVHACRAGGWAYAGGCAPSADDAAMPVRSGHGRLRCRGGDTLDATFAAGAVVEASMGVLRYACGALYFGQLRAAAGGGGMQAPVVSNRGVKRAKPAPAAPLVFAATCAGLIAQPTGVPHGYGELYLQGVHAPSHDKRRPAPPLPRPCGTGSSGGGSGGAAAASGAGCCCENGAAAAALLALGAAAACALLAAAVAAAAATAAAATAAAAGGDGGGQRCTRSEGRVRFTGQLLRKHSSPPTVCPMPGAMLRRRCSLNWKLATLTSDLLWYKGEFRDGLPDGRGLVNFRDRPRRDAQAADATATGARAAAPFCTVGAPASAAGGGGFGGFDDHFTAKINHLPGGGARLLHGLGGAFFTPRGSHASAPASSPFTPGQLDQQACAMFHAAEQEQFFLVPAAVTGRRGGAAAGRLASNGSALAGPPGSAGTADEDEDDDHDPSDTPQGPLSPSAGAAPSAAADFKNIRSCEDAHARGLRLDFEIEMRRGALVRRSSLRLAALKMARAELRRLERAVQQERRSLQMLQAQRHCLVCSAREINALLNAHDARCCHRCLCIACAATARECPLCRTPVDPAKTIQIFST